MMPSTKLKTKPKPDFKGLILEFEAIGTFWSIKLDQQLSKTEETSLSKVIQDRINLFDKNYSRFRSDSLVSQMAKNKGMYKLPNDSKLLIDTYNKLYELTGGLMTPLIGQMLADSGYDANYSFEAKPLSEAPVWNDVIEYNYPWLKLKQAALLDFGAAGKGYIVDLVAAIIKKAGVKKFSINAGGDILNFNLPDSLSSVGLEHPTNLDEVIGVAELNNGAICGSAINRRSWKGYNHVINPKTMKSITKIVATWVVSEHALIADALSTALFFIPASTLKDSYDFEYAIINQDSSLEYSRNFPARFYT
jgi:thiamine biosynthesis lipoprotein